MPPVPTVTYHFCAPFYGNIAAVVSPKDRAAETHRDRTTQKATARAAAFPENIDLPRSEIGYLKKERTTTYSKTMTRIHEPAPATRDFHQRLLLRSAVFAGISSGGRFLLPRIKRSSA